MQNFQENKEQNFMVQNNNFKKLDKIFSPFYGLKLAFLNLNNK